MPLPQDISPVNSQLQDTLVRAAQMDWLEYDNGGYLKVLYCGSETGHWAVLFRWKKGYIAGQHKHLSGSHTYVLSGKLQVRDGVLNAGDYVYEPNGMLHGETKALEDTEYLFICEGPLLGFDDNNFTGYFGWEELERMRKDPAELERQRARNIALNTR